MKTFLMFIIGILLFWNIISCSEQRNIEQKVPVSSHEQINVEEENDRRWVPAFTGNGIYYPIFFGMNADIINQIIEGEVDKLNKAYDITPESVIDFVVAYDSEKYTAVLFSGYLAYGDFAYVATISWPIMIDIKNGTIVTLKDIVEVDGNLIDLVTKELVYYFYEIETDMEEYYPKERLENSLLKADIFEDGTIPGVRSYFTDEKLYISFSIPRVLGEFIDVELPITELNIKIVIELFRNFSF